MVMCYASMLTFEPQPVQFHVQHPFNYYIINKDSTILFAGRINKF